MPAFEYTVVVLTDTEDHANQVMIERLEHDEDYGFDYTIVFDEELADKLE